MFSCQEEKWAHLKNTDNLVDDHKDPHHGDSEPKEAQADASGVARVIEETKGEERAEEADDQGGERVPPSQVVGCKTEGQSQNQIVT